MSDPWECIVVGGGAAGLSAALVLGRARRRVLVVDAGAPSNLVAHGIGGLLGHDGRPPAELYAAGRAELTAYPSVVVREGTALRGERHGDGFVLELADGSVETASTVILATGADYRTPELPGLAERWGRSVFHCPFCHGWELRERALAALDDGPTAVHRGLLLRMWSDDVTVLTDGPSSLDDGERAELARAGVAIDERPVASLRGPGDELEAVVFADGTERACGGLLVPVALHQRSPLALQLGAGTTALSPVAPDAIDVDAVLESQVPGLLAAGDASAAMPSVANAVAAGALAAASVVRRLSAALATPAAP